jgi:hypothetical protein
VRINAMREEFRIVPEIVAVNMGYGHMRPAQSLSVALDVPVSFADREPLADEDDMLVWHRTLKFYEWSSRLSQIPAWGAPLRALFHTATSIPHLYPLRDLSAPTWAVRFLDRQIDNGFGLRLTRHLEDTGRPLVTSFYLPAFVAERMGHESIYCIVTDTDINRIWAPIDTKRTSIQYLVPTVRTRLRLEAYGVPPGNIHLTGFPLPPSLLGGRQLSILRKNLAARLSRLDPQGVFRLHHAGEVERVLEIPLPSPSEPPRLMFAVGGAGAQSDVARMFLPSLRRALLAKRLRLTLVAGTRPEVAGDFRRWLAAAGLSSLGDESVRILLEKDFESYVAAFNEELARTDMLWTKPSELSFYGALGIPLILSWPVGAHEVYNRRWAIEHGAGIKQRDPRHAGEWIEEMLAAGTLAGAAWSGFLRMPKDGVFRIADIVTGRSGGVSVAGLNHLGSSRRSDSFRPPIDL